MLPPTVESLSSHDRIVGIKEAVPGADRIEELSRRCGPGFSILSGDDSSCLESMRHGAVGVVSVAANVIPEAMHDLCAAAIEQDWTRAERVRSRLKALFDVLMIETNPIPVKWALFQMGLVGPKLRLPLTQLDEKYVERVRKCLVEQELLAA
jgi:dihydrodipicolinate synthase/N-acetylneuraminate lyase